MKDIVIVGAGGFGREVQWLIERINKNRLDKKENALWNIIGYIDDGLEEGMEINGYEVLGGTDYLVQYPHILSVACAIGNASVRKHVAKKITNNTNLSFPNLIDPSVKMSQWIQLGKGNIICSDNILTVNIEVSDFCILNLDCTLGHDTVLESYITLYPSVNISGGVRVGECTEVGTGTHIIQGKMIGKNSIIGAGAVVIKDIPDGCTAVGNPCRAIKYNK